MPAPERTPDRATSRSGRRAAMPIVGTALVDLLALAAAFVLAYLLHFRAGLFVLSSGSDSLGRYLQAMALLAPLWLLLFAYRGMYAAEVLQHGTRLSIRTAETSLAAALASLAAIYLSGSPLLSRGWFVATTMLSVLFVVAGRRLLLAARRRRGRRDPWRLLILGASEIGAGAARSLARRPDLRVVGFLDDYLPLGVPIGGLRVLGRPAEVRRVAAETQADELLVVEGALPQESYDRLLRAAYTSPGLPPLRLVPSVAGELVARLQPAARGAVPILIPELGRIAGPDRLAKALLDRGLALLALTLTAPLLLLLWLGARRHRLPFLRRTPMVGQGGRRFLRYSLQLWWRPGDFPDRMLRLNSFPERSGPAYLLTKLPRLVNVLRGELSIVGPRPMTADELTPFSEWTGVLLAMQPGLIGPWLLHGKSTLTLEEELQADLAYVRDYTLPRDLAILAGASRQLAAALRHAPRAEARTYSRPSTEPGTQSNVAEAEVQPVRR